MALGRRLGYGSWLHHPLAVGTQMPTLIRTRPIEERSDTTAVDVNGDAT
jgi:hypothetical protein